MAGTRQDLAKLPAGWNPTVLWYAKAIVELDKLAIDKRTSWRFMGAMHGFDPAGWRAKGLIRAGERPPAELTDNNTFGNQCQHGSWYFLPWHRGYLAAFEAIVAAKIKEMGGPADWALPYWNYLDRSNPNARRIPWAFLEATLPGGTRNPLNTPPRSGAPVLTPPDPGIPDINLDAVTELDFVVGANGSIGFGGGRSGFAQFNAFTGQLEGNPHNPVHVMVGGLGSGARAGWMSDPDYAGLDPIFWVHHCNVDRLWEAWMGAPGRTMVSEATWRDGPANRRFVMPKPDGGSFTFTPRDTLRGGPLHPDYDDLVSGTGLPAAAPAAAATGVGMGTTRVQEVAVLGASDTSVNVGERPAAATVRLDPGPAGAAVRAMGPLDSGADVSRLYLQLDNVTGAAPSAVIDVFVNLPEGTSPAEGSAYRAGSLYLFGLAKASAPDGDHAGNGLGFSMDITELAGQLTERREFDPQKLDVLIVPAGGSSAESPVKVGGIKVLERRVKAAR